MARLLVTGASGFVGGALVERLAGEERWRPVAASRRDLSLPEGAEVVVAPSLGPDADWGSAVRDADAVVHAAARVHVMEEGSADPLSEYRHTNVEGTLALARQAAQAGVRRFVFVSSIKVNGEQTAPGSAFTAADAVAPVDPYGVSKAEAEAALFALGRETGMEIVAVRPPLVYGHGAGGNFARMARWVGKGVPLLLGAVDNRRSLIGLDNLVDLLMTCVEHPDAANRVFLAGDGEDLSTTDLLRRVAVAMDRRARLVPFPPVLLRAAARAVGRDDLARRLLDSLQVDITDTCETLGWEPPVSVDEGLRRSVRALLQ
ncbi:NAD-dependent epimerase/dehydratase family protein [Thioalkalivibrio sp. ALJ1]|uniref:NAD-dependent epimerase/dehydratase family protein n=1 Tax=Thioalkalivibrio sp. ALJ1 TaxID=1158144 RepID=UPI0005701190|nr:NAD-dependent epimerase/dehydratase family protein [Thioalkalivibrio sp. ALJ1]